MVVMIYIYVGVGRVTDNLLSELGLKTMGDVRSQKDKVLVAFSPKQGRFLIRVSLGIDSSEGVKENKNSDGECDEDQPGLQKSIGSDED